MYGVCTPIVDRNTSTQRVRKVKRIVYFMEVVAKESFYTLYWGDEAHTILIADVYARWTWEEAASHLARVNAFVRAQPQPLYMVGVLNVVAPFTPERSLLSLIRDMIDDNENELMLVLCGRYHFLQMFLDLVGAMYNLKFVVQRYRYADTLDEALTIIETDRRARIGQSSTSR